MIRKKNENIDHQSAAFNHIAYVLAGAGVAYIVLFVADQLFVIPQNVLLILLGIVMTLMLITSVAAAIFLVRVLIHEGRQYRRAYVDFGLIVALIIVAGFNILYLRKPEEYANTLPLTTIGLSFLTAWQVLYAFIDDIARLTKNQKKVVETKMADIITAEQVKADIDKLVADTIQIRNTEMATVMIEEGILTEEKIADYTGLSLESIKTLKISMMDTEQKAAAELEKTPN